MAISLFCMLYYTAALHLPYSTSRTPPPALHLPHSTSHTPPPALHLPYSTSHTPPLALYSKIPVDNGSNVACLTIKGTNVKSIQHCRVGFWKHVGLDLKELS